jgi:hypothetical protein
MESGQESDKENLATNKPQEKKRKRMEFGSSGIPPLIKAMTLDERAMVKEAMHGEGSGNEILAQLGTDSVQRGSMHRLQSERWLNDELIH